MGDLDPEQIERVQEILRTWKKEDLRKWIMPLGGDRVSRRLIIGRFQIASVFWFVRDNGWKVWEQRFTA